MKYSISVVIPNYNGRQLLEENLPPLYEALYLSGVEYEVIIPDDCSTDDSVSFLKTHYPNIIVVEHSVNKGFAPNVNAGIFIATKTLVFIMNSDVKLTGDYFTEQFSYFEDATTFGVQGRIIGYDNDRIQDGAKMPYTSGLKIGSEANLIPQGNDSGWFPTLYLSGANALVDRKKLFELGGFDELYAPFYGEDLDLCFRAWKVGWKCYYHHNAICRHPNSVTIQKYNKKRKIKIIVYRNRFIMHGIYLSGVDLWRWNIWVRLQLVVKILCFQTEFLEGFRQFKESKPAIDISKQRLKSLGASTGINKTNVEVYEYLFECQAKIQHCKV